MRIAETGGYDEKTKQFERKADVTIATSYLSRADNGILRGRWRRRPDLNRRMEVLQTSALPLGYGALKGRTTALRGEEWSGKRDSNPRLRPWQGRTLPLSYSRSPTALLT